MKTTMSVNAVHVPIGEISLHFQYFKDDSPPCASLDLHSDSDNASLGGVAINCFDIGDIPALSGVFGKTFKVGASEQAVGAELTESVLWKPRHQTLELSSLQLTFGQPEGEFLAIELVAVCSDHQGERGIKVLVSGAARMPTQRAASAQE